MEHYNIFHILLKLTHPSSLSHPILPCSNEGFIIPSQVNYVVKGGQIIPPTEPVSGAYSVVSRWDIVDNLLLIVYFMFAMIDTFFYKLINVYAFLQYYYTV